MLREVTPGPGDLDDLMRLVTEAGWNQIAADWRMMMRAGRTFGVRDGGRVVASALALPYGPDFGWISMVLVAGSHRRQGMATRLMRACIAHLERAGLAQVLDATPEGFKVYEKMGFRPDVSYTRWARPARSAPPCVSRPAILPVSVLARDADLSGANRRAILTDIAGRGAPHVFGPEGQDFGMSRTGNLAVQIGPLAARDEQQAREMFGHLDAAIPGRAIVDIPDAHTDFGRWVEARGYEPVRPFTRMIRGDAHCPAPAQVYAFAGPELG